MAQDRLIKVGALNIKTHPHSPEGYLKLMRAAYDARRAVRYHGNNYAMLGSFRAIHEDDWLAGVEGEIHKFVDFDRTAPWLNLAQNKIADDSDLKSISVPEHLKPQFVPVRYAFFPKGHRFFFESYSRSGYLRPSSAQRIMRAMLSSPALAEQFGEVDVIVEPQRDALQKVLSLSRLERVEIHLTRPNPDDHGDADAAVLRRLQRQGAKAMTIELDAASNQSIQLDEQNTTLARVASSNGHVASRGKDANGRTVYESTKEHPLEDSISYNPDNVTDHAAFLSQVLVLLQRLVL